MTLRSMVTLISRSPEETRTIGRAWGTEAPDSWLIGLSGDLGAGKTQLVKGIAEGLAVTARVHSPTFAIVHEYTGGRVPLWHLDLYRLETTAQLRSAGIEDYLLSPGGVVVVEWFERWLSAGMPVGLAPCRRVELRVLDERTRQISYDDARA